LIFACEHDLCSEDVNVVVHVINKAVEEFKRPIVILAKSFDNYMFNLLVSNKLKNKENFPVCPVDISVGSEERYEKYIDLLTYLGAKSYNRFDHGHLLGEENGIFGNGFIGRCKTFTADEVKSRFIKGCGSEKNIKERITHIEKKLEEFLAQEEKNFERSSEFYELKRRIANLSNSMVNIRVGGSSDIERTSRLHLFEDATYACQSAIQYGYVPGGNLMSVKVLNDPKVLNSMKKKLKKLNIFKSNIVDTEVIDDLINSVRDAFLNVYRLVLSNSNLSEDSINGIIDTCNKENKIFNVKTFKYESMGKTKIINSAETDIQIIKSCFSIIGLICTSNQFITVDDGYNEVELCNNCENGSDSPLRVLPV
jgi:chaperonin GroEL (HSP60 family)